MLVSKAFDICKKIIDKEVQEYKENPENQIKDNDGNVTGYKSSPLLLINDDDIIFQLGISLVNVALQTIPITLLEDSNTSTANILKMVSTKKFVRVPATPVAVTDDNKDTQKLDIDDALAYAVIFDALANLYDGFSAYAQKASLIIMNFNNAYKSIIQDILNGTTATNNSWTAIRFSSDNENWHDTYQDGDIYISFKRPDTGEWTAGVRFVGKDGTPCSDTEFTALKDTPSDYTGNKGKIVAVKDTEDGVEFIDPPSGGDGGASNFTDLNDTPSNYNDSANKFVKVNADANGLEFVDETIPAKSTDLSDMPSTLTAGKMLSVKSDASGYELVDPPSGSSGGNTAPFYTEDAGTITLDGFTYTTFTIFPSDDGDVTLEWKDDGNKNYGVNGQVYTLNVIMYDKNSASLSDSGGNITYVGDTSISDGSGSSNTSQTLTTMRLLYLDGEFVIIENTKVTDV